ncbi:MAG: ABC transporter ATP-binding protein [Candidatus Euphemobacter frigidus]|nr:ABC transporter ATP-binding protein [Candidatus Euphemobacter frigidus]
MTVTLKLENLHTYFHLEGQTLKAVRGIGFTLKRGETLGLVGESGCGKTVTALSLMRLVPAPGRIEAGRVWLENRKGERRDLLVIPERQMRAVRGKEMAMIFQEPMTSLNPVFTIGDQIMEAILVHEKTGRREALQRAIELLRNVNIPSPELRIKDYPHQLSGGQRQRVMIAMALSCRPEVLIADEPTTALDVTVQARILQLLSRLREKYKMAVLLVTHDLGVVAQDTDRVAVMYLGRIVEDAPTTTLFARPLHPYTRALMESIPRLGEEKKRLKTIRGAVPTLSRIPSGCSFHPRCPLAREICREREPIPREITPGHRVECHLFHE